MDSKCKHTCKYVYLERQRGFGDSLTESSEDEADWSDVAREPEASIQKLKEAWNGLSPRVPRMECSIAGFQTSGLKNSEMGNFRYDRLIVKFLTDFPLNSSTH